MRFKNFKDLTLGKTRDKEEDETGAGDSSQENKIAEMGKKIDSRTKNLEETTQQLQELSDKNEGSADDQETEAGPHGPLSELQVEPEAETEDDELDLGSIVSADDSDDEDEYEGEAGGAEIKVVDLSKPEAEPELKAAQTSAGDVKLDGGGDNFNNLFSEEEDEENPLANLITSLPDVTTEELIDDLKEIKEIIQEWQHN